MTPTNTEALAARLESGWCPIESPTDMGRAAAELHRLSAVEAERDALRAELDELYRLRAAPTEQAQEPVAWQSVGGSIWAHKTREDDRPLYAAPVEQAQESDPTSDAFKAGMAAMEYAIWEGKEPCPCRKQAAQAVPAGFVLVPVEFIEAGQRIAQDYARTNPKWPMWDNGEAEPKVQDPCGAHAWLERAAMLAAAPTPPAPEAQQAAGQEPYTSDRHFALREAHCIGDGEKFWKARPGTNKDNGRAIAFDDGYVRGFDKGTELADARAAVSAANSLAQRREPLTDADAYRIVCEFFSQPWHRLVATEVVRATEKAHGIGATTGEQR